MGPVDPVVQRPGHRMGTTTLLRGDVMNAASPDRDTPDLDNIAERLRLDKIETVICAIPDIWGRLVGKRVTTESFLKTALGSEGLHGSLYLFVVDMDMDPRPGYAVSNWNSGFSDFRLVPDVSTLRTLPWLPATAIVVCDAFAEDSDELVEVAPRTILRRQIEAGRAAGVTFKFASELEFYLYRNAPADAWQRQYQGLEPLSYYRSDYHILQSSKDDWIIAKIRNGMNAAGIEVEFSKSERGLGDRRAQRPHRDVHGQAVDGRHRLVLPRPRQLVGRDRRQVAHARRAVAGPHVGGVPNLPGRAAGELPSAGLDVGSQRQLLQALPVVVVRPHRDRLGPGQPHLRVPGGGRARVAPGREPDPGRRRQPLPGVRVHDDGGTVRHAGEDRLRPGAHRERIRRPRAGHHPGDAARRGRGVRAQPAGGRRARRRRPRASGQLRTPGTPGLRA